MKVARWMLIGALCLGAGGCTGSDDAGEDPSTTTGVGPGSETTAEGGGDDSSEEERELPGDFPRPDGARDEQTFQAAGGYGVTYRVPGGVEATAAFFESELEGAGYEITRREESTANDAPFIVLTFAGDDRGGVTIGRTEDGETDVSVTLAAD